MKASKKKRPPFVVRRQEVGLYIMNTRHGGTVCWVIYEEWMSDGSTRKKRGTSLRGTGLGFQDMNGTKAQRQRAAHSLASPELSITMQAAGILQAMLISRCVEMDTNLGLPIGDFFDGKGAGGRT